MKCSKRKTSKKSGVSEIDQYIEDKKTRVKKRLEKYISGVRKKHSGLADAVAHTLTHGKKIRPVLCIAACESVGGNMDQAMPAACAIEMIHSYSLIHDDLPSMDNDDTRRGLPSAHRMFGESTAILTGDLLLTDSFGFLVSEGRAANLADSVLIETVEIISDSAGKSGMAVGQMMDLENANPADRKQSTEIHSLKTGALIKSSVRCGAIAAGADGRRIEPLVKYAEAIGLAFQALDDIIDSSGADLRTQTGEKKERAEELTRKAIKELDRFDGEKTVLKNLALRLCERTV